MKFSVLMTTYYKETPDNLDDALRSITVNQTIVPDQIVLVLDGPVGNHLENVINKYTKMYPEIIFVHRLPVNFGQGKASAEGVKYCKYDYIARMDSDDVSISTRFETQISIFKMFPEVSVVAGYIGEFEENPNIIERVRTVPENHEDICKMFKYRNPINNVTVMYNKESLKKAGGYISKSVNEDFAIYVRMLVTDSIFYNIPEVLVHVRAGKDMVKRRGDIKIFFDWCKDQKILLNARKTNIISYIISCTGCLFFIITPYRIKQFLYSNFLRKKEK